ncbi:MAG: Glu-tRNA(Gln) amidotransferase GatDE subunit E [Deltaproteobacteria bacterium]|nr:MAG: Glu-tRNA(Gln) amidotransferase GatDE subunit E [Deltaproteobacteria bacterium]
MSRGDPNLNPRTEPVLDFPDRDLGDLAPADYAELGFMAGLEVHQQLLTTSKLFCRCPAGVRATRVDAEVLRHMRPTLSELGEYDGTALMEFKTRKDIVYLLERGSVCTYEIDDTPPFEIDREAVHIALRIARLFGLNLVSELHVMRKQYLDGSIPTGFQRTAMVGLAGEIPFRDSELGRDRVLRIRQMSLEEDSCREVSDVGHRIVFRTDRLGMPLIETVTEPELLTPNDVRAGGELLAQVARSTGHVRRGPGAARQDVNVSVAGGRRVEIKGVPSLRLVPKLVHIEAYRQLNLLRVREALRERGVTRDHFALPDTGAPWDVSPLVVDARSVARKSSYVPVREAVSAGDTVAAVRLPGFRRLLVHRTQPGVTFASELADRVRVIACLVGRPFMIHSDVVDYGVEGPVWQQLRGATGADGDDALVLVWGPERDVATAAREILARAAEAVDGVPAETRQAFGDGTTGFERILPGPDRMYPDTDTPPLPIPDAWVDAAAANPPELPWERRARYEALGLDGRTARRLAAADWAGLFDAIAPPAGVPARRVAAAFAARLPAHVRAGGALPAADRVRPLVPLARRAGGAEAFDRALAAVLAGAEPGEVVARLAPAPDTEVDRAIADAVAASERARSSDPEAVLRFAMGHAMAPLRGRVDPRVVRARLVEQLGMRS